MKFIEELVVEEFLPTIRSMLAEALRDRELTQREVADVLGISQSAVSKYAHGEVARNERIAADRRVADLVEGVADGLATGDMSRVQALVEIEVLIRQLEDGDLLAELHEDAMPGLVEADVDFSVHDPDSRIRTTEQVRSSVRRGLRTLTNMGGFAALIPNVGSNLVECLPDAATVDDVAGVPGRIFDIKGRATVPSDPEFGVSEHVASVLLAARTHAVDVQAGLNIAYDPDLVAAFEDAGYTTVEFDSEAREELDATIGAAVAEADLSETFVCYQTGGFGIEPISYVLGPDAPTVAAAVRAVA
ncbi:thiamine-phosphate synthase family protein [Halohasta salina]|uniref:thiamine-phosphate synthase family protein n=1 Tax=Halohasta salina TaxID=2961621 RepID=UPI0020A2D09B|nr:thiamine-phosphate synthase family protein [Halohasta salina]